MISEIEIHDNNIFVMSLQSSIDNPKELIVKYMLYLSELNKKNVLIADKYLT